MPDLSDRLKELRTSNNLTQKKISEMLGISERAYQHYEYGSREPNLETLSRLASFFNCSVDYLLGRTEIKEISASNKEVIYMPKNANLYISVNEDFKSEAEELFSNLDMTVTFHGKELN